MDDVIGLIYETVAEPELWDEVAVRLKNRFEAQSSWLFRPMPTGPDLLVLDGIPTQFWADYAAHYHTVDIAVQAWRRNPAPWADRVVRHIDLVSEEAWHKSEIYNDLGNPNGIAQLMSASLDSLASPGGSDQSAGALLSFFRAGDAPLFDDAVVAAYQDVLPHLRRAVRLRQRLSAGLQPLPGWSVALLNQIAAGLFLLDGQGRLIHANTAGRAMLDKRDGLLLRHGRVGAVDRGAADRLDAILRACVTGRTRGGEMRLPRALGYWLLSACPLADAATMFDAVGQCRAWIWVSAPDAHRSDLQRRLEMVFGLTAAEQRVAAAMLAGLTTAEIADRHGVSLATIRSQVQAIFARMGVRRQADMIRLLAEVSALPAP